MTQGVNASSGGNVSLPSQNPTEVNGRLVVAPPGGYSKKTSGLLVRVIIALMDAIRRFCAGLFFRSEEEITQILGQFDAVSHENDGLKRLEELKKLEELLQGLSGRGVRYILGEFIKQISDRGEGEISFNTAVEVSLFFNLCKGYHLKSSLRNSSCLCFVDWRILARLEGEDRFRIYAILKRCDPTFMEELFNDFRESFEICTYCTENVISPEGGYYTNVSITEDIKIKEQSFFNASKIPHNPEQALHLLGDIAKHVLVEGNHRYNGIDDRYVVGYSVRVFSDLFQIFCQYSYYSRKQCAQLILSQLEGEDRRIAKRVLRRYRSVLIRALG